MEYVEVALAIDDLELRAKIETMANDLGVTPERLIETVISASVRQ